MSIKELVNSFIYLFFPEDCEICGKPLIVNENSICLSCQIDLPCSGIDDLKDNILSQLFWGRTNIENTFSLYVFQKAGKLQTLIHGLKYKNKKQIGVKLGNLLAKKLKEFEEIKSIDYIVPVPLHKKKLRKRGYNQSEIIAGEVAKELKIKLNCNNLLRIYDYGSQTRKSRFARWENVENIFKIKNSKMFDNKHIMIIDDILTTGATLEACANEILKSKNSKVSISTIAYA